MCKTSRKQKLKDLRIISDRLNKLHENGIILGDLTLKSVFANKKDLEFLNLDNCCIGKYGFDYPNFNQKRYLDIIGEVDEKLDTYMLNLLTMTYLENLTDQGILYYIRKNRPSFTLDTRRNESILESMVYLDKESKNNIDLLIDNMRYVKKK